MFSVRQIDAVARIDKYPERAQKVYGAPEAAKRGGTTRADVGRELALPLASDTLWTALLVGASVLILSMLVGLAISVLQVVTQIQESSLSFVPKIAAALLALVASGPWMLSVVVQFAARLIGNIPLYF